MINKLGSKAVIIAVMVAATFLITLLFENMGVFKNLEYTSFDHRVQFFRYDKQAHEDIVVVMLDEQSLQTMQSRFGRWPWPRSAYTDLLGFLKQADAQSVAFDILFSEQQNSTSSANNTDDLGLIAATKDAGNVIHAIQLTDIANLTNGRPLPIPFVQQHQIDSIRYVGKEYNNYLIPFDGLYQAANGVGNIEVEPDSDGIYRRVRLFNQYQQAVFPAISTALALPLVSDMQNIRYGKNRVELSGFDIPLDGNGKYLINSVGQIEVVSISAIFKTVDQQRAGETDVANLALDPADFKDKIVFVGASAIGLLDVKATALSPVEPGVFLHASTVSNILQQDFLTTISTASQYALYFIAAVISVASITLISRLMLAALVPFVFISAYVFIAYYSFAENLVIPIIGVIFISGFSVFIAVYYRLSKERKNKQKVRTMLSQYVSPGVLTSLIDQNDVLEASVGKSENLTILFSDIRSFTNISEQFDAKQIVDLLNIYFSDMTDIVFEYHGTLNKFIGDALLAFWGAPIKSDNHADEALAAALMMRERMPEVNKKLKEKGYVGIEVGIGLHTGNVVLGNIGSHRKLDYTIIGDGVNLASRTEGLTKQYGVSVLLTEDTLTALKTPVSCIKVDKVRVKGKKQPVLLYTTAKTFIDENNLDLNEKELMKITDSAFDLYHNKQWQQTKEKLHAIGNTYLYKIISDRCDHYMMNSPEGDWDGVYEHTSK